MALEMQELSGSSDGEQLDLEVPDSEIARALNQPNNVDDNEAGPRTPNRPSRARSALRTFGLMFAIVGVIAALGFIFYGQRERDIEQAHLVEELKQVETFVQYLPDEEPLDELAAATLKITDPPPMKGITTP